MSREIADIIRRFGKAFIDQHFPNSYQISVLDALAKCRTASLGGHKYRCDHCGKEHIRYNSCRNRHCSKCHLAKQAFWAEDRIGKTFPGKHFHIVFTVPAELNQIALIDNRWFYNSLFAALWDTLRTFGYSRYGAETGAICTLHTWGQNLSFHPHVHCIVPAIGQKPSGKLINISKNGKYLYPVEMLSAVFKGKLMEILHRKLIAENLLDQYKASIKSAWNKPWVVFCEPSLGKPDQLIKYLGQYVHRVAISNQRIIHLDDEKVTFQMKDYRDNAVNKYASLTGVEFLRRFCMHILPKRFVKIRYFGIYSSKISPTLLNKAHQLVIKPTESVAERLKRLCNIDVHLCPSCKKGPLALVETYPRIRSPGFFSYRIIL